MTGRGCLPRQSLTLRGAGTAPATPSHSAHIGRRRIGSAPPPSSWLSRHGAVPSLSSCGPGDAAAEMARPPSRTHHWSSGTLAMLPCCTLRSAMWGPVGGAARSAPRGIVPLQCNEDPGAPFCTTVTSSCNGEAALKSSDSNANSAELVHRFVGTAASADSATSVAPPVMSSNVARTSTEQAVEEDGFRGRPLTSTASMQTQSVPPDVRERVEIARVALS